MFFHLRAPRYETDRRADRDQINAMIAKNETDRKFDTNRAAHALTHFEHQRVVDAQVCGQWFTVRDQR